MIKRSIFIFLILFIISPLMVNASASSLARIGNNYYDSLIDAIKNASSTDVITLINDVSLNETLEINKTVNINLNGNDITAKEKVFLVKGGVLNLDGEGTIKETEPNYGAIMVIGSDDQSKKDYSIVNIGKNVTLEGWSGIFITHESSKSYGVVVNLKGKINAVNDTAGGTGIGVYVNGNIKDETNSPIVNIQDGANITSTGNGLYIAGNSTFNIKKATISGIESGIGIKSGTLNIDGATITSNGKDKTPTEGYTNGIKASGTALQIESNSGYAGNMKINIRDGNFKSKNSNVIYEYIGKGSTTQVDSIDISGGSFISEADKSTLRFSESFANKHKSFITGGTYSSSPSTYLKSGYTTTMEDANLYTVVESTMKEEKTISQNEINEKNNNLGKILITLITLIASGLIIYFNKSKILNFIRK